MFAYLVIPLAAEDEFLHWIDAKFLEVAQTEAWSKWYDLLQLVYNPLKDESDEKPETNSNNDNNHLVDVDIFDDTEANTFDETIFTSHKCYIIMMKHIENATIDPIKKDEIRSKFTSLQNI